MIEDIRLSVSFFAHRKTKKLMKALGSDGVLALLRLWTRVAIERPSGVLTGWDNEDIALEADYPGDPDEFVEGLLRVGFLDETDSGYALHNWSERQEWVAGVDERGDRARLSRLARTRRAAYDLLAERGVIGVSRDQYSMLVAARHDNDLPAMVEEIVSGRTAAATTANNPSSTTVQRPYNDRTTTPNSPSTPAPAPAPYHAPAPTHNVDILPAPNGASSAETAKKQAKERRCPHQEIIAAYHEILPMLPRVKAWPESRRRLLSARWREDRARQSLEWWRDYFTLVKQCPFLLGREKEWRADLEWLIRPRNMPKVLDGRYQRQQQKDGGGRLSKAGARTAQAAREWMEQG